MKAKLAEAAAALDAQKQVHFCGPVNGPAKWEAYRDADVFVLPSQNENFGNTAAEAVAAGTPVIVTDQCGIAPLLKDLAGLVVRHQEEDLTEALAQLLGDPLLWRKLQQGCGTAASSMSWDEPLREMEMMYSALASRLET